MNKLEEKKRARGVLEAIVATVAAEDPRLHRFLRDFAVTYPQPGA